VVSFSPVSPPRPYTPLSHHAYAPHAQPISLRCCHYSSILGQPNPVHIPTSHLLEIYPNIIHPSTPRSPQWLFPSFFPTKTLYTPLSSPICATCPAHLITVLPLLIFYATVTLQHVNHFTDIQFITQLSGIITYYYLVSVCTLEAYTSVFSFVFLVALPDDDRKYRP